ncbi:FAD-dependent oxidoreductase [Amycolatopsis sp. K13G38]|uniref:FAD-dependent oxidoreductase n=1 Tax=Amycolatopsis acididurans TaxID=2724524 RepID=A0ABX1J787_9PSEU|nr:FAD-dependent oxidoreductase [Amycolatopsis acididurans]NKQ55656.1 FAD-dependent oxidoreductase [Amycolatopsis acididurans]
MTDSDVMVIGGGTAGLAAATAARRAGLTAVLISDGDPGGDCTFTGCVPSKTLLHAAAFGLPFTNALARVRHTVARVAATEDDDALRRQGIEVVRGRARIVSHRMVSVDDRRMTARRIVLATGARPDVPAVPGLDRVPLLTTETVFELTEAPRSLVVLGGGAVGCELAQAFAQLGVGVTVIEAELPALDPEASAVLAEALADDGVRLRLGTRVQSARMEGEQVLLELDDGGMVRADRLLVATGRRPDTHELGLDAVGIRTDAQGFVAVDRHMSTSVDGIFAAGDVTGLFPHTHGAYAMGRIAVTAGLRRMRRPAFDPGSIPTVVFTDPEIAVVGATEHDLAGTSARVAWLPMTEADRAITAADPRGFVKLLAGPRRLLGHAGGGRVLGATIVAERAGEMIHEPALAMATGMFTGRLAQAVHAYPSWSLAIQQTAAQFVGGHGGRTARPAGPART